MREEDLIKEKEINFHPEMLIFYHIISADPLIKITKDLIDIVRLEPGRQINRDRIFYQICAELVKKAEEYHWEGDLWEHFLSYLIAQAENTFSRTCAWTHGKIDSSLIKLAAHDMQYVKQIWDFDFRDLGEWVPGDIVDTLESFTNKFPHPGQTMNRHYRESVITLKESLKKINDPEQLVGSLADFYGRLGYGKMGLFSSFRWEEGKGLVGIPYPDQVILEDLIGYEHQKETIIKNTEAFALGRKANNMLLYGERGTGKSSTIKALINEYYTWGLRLLEVNKSQFINFQEMMRELRAYPQRFLIFIDDLSFESNETEYKYLKYILEGGMEVLPDNVVIYATSNRRHLVQENWHDREGGGEVRILDAISEKLSLADRFGITVTFTSPDQEEYLKIVAGLAERSCLDIPLTELRERALQWERWHNGRSGRTAKQFIHSLSTEL